MCSVEYENNRYKNNFNSLCTLKEVKQSLKRQIMKNETPGEKMVKLYHDGKELRGDNILVGDVCQRDEMNLIMISLTLTDELLNDQKKMDEKVITGLIKKCELHGGKASLICISCGVSICPACEKEHSEHKVVNKGDIMQHEEDLRGIYDNLNEKLHEIGITDDNINMNINTQDLNRQCEELVHKVEQIKKRVIKIENNYKYNFDTIFPPILDYKDKVRDLISQISVNKRETILRNDKEFVDFYLKYQQLFSYNERNTENVGVLRKKLERYTRLMTEFKSKTEEIIKFINEQIENQVEYKTADEGGFHDNLEEKVEVPDKSPTGSKMRSINPENKLSLITLFNSPSKNPKDIVKNFASQSGRLKLSLDELSKVGKLNSSKFSETIKLDDEAVLPNTLQKKILSLEVGSKSVYIYDTSDKCIIKKELDLSQTMIKRFEAYHSALNFNDKFYISGGYSPSKVVYEYHIEGNEFKRLTDMQFGHSYHSLIGVGRSIYAISGFKNKKVQKYDFDKWTALPEVNHARTWPSLVNVDNKFIYIIGGLIDNDTKSNSTLERLDLKVSKQWEVIEIASAEYPYNFASIYIKNDKVILLGGMINKNEETTDKCWILDLNSKTLSDHESLKLPSRDEFDGRQFIPLDGGGAKFGLFSSVVFEKFYSYDKDTNIFDIIEYK
jgi:hypothetical protein